MYWPTFAFLGISIHAPLRERRAAATYLGQFIFGFQSTLPYGSDQLNYLVA